MSIDQTQTGYFSETASPVRTLRTWRSVRRQVYRALVVLVAVFVVGGSAPNPDQELRAGLTMTVGGYTFDLMRWEVDALRGKLWAAYAQPARGLPYAEASGLVRTYLDRAQEIDALERTIERIYSENGGHATPETERLRADTDALRQRQEQARPAVEQVLESQVGSELAKAGLQWQGLPFPPVQFTFVEPPKKMVVSPRSRIETIFSRMLTADISVEKAEQAEHAINDRYDLSAYITRIGGLGAYPSMVVDRASLPWVLNTVAHEWTHNYLTLFPLGLNYNTRPELTTINETVAEIVGDEIGARALRTFYPDLVPPETMEEQTEVYPAAAVPPGFEFDAEMHKTRLEVDRLLAAGRVDDAEKYMEQRRRFFVANGYPLRVLNQAYFAFHGSYGTSPASTDPIGPKLLELRDRSSDVRAFLRTVRSITSVEELDRLLATHDHGQ